jgi:hypothetical protein
MRFDRATRRRVSMLLDAAPLAAAPSPPEVRRTLARAGREAVPELLELIAADAGGAETAFHREARAVLAAGDPLAVSELAVRGDELMAALGLGPGPAVGRILDALFRHVLERPGDNRAERLIEIAGEVVGR